MNSTNSETDSISSSKSDAYKQHSNTSSNISLKSYTSGVSTNSSGKSTRSAQSMTSEKSVKSSGSGGSKRPSKNPEKQVQVVQEEDTRSEGASSKASKRGPWQTGIAESKTTIKVRKDGSGVYQMKWGRPKTSGCSRKSAGVAVKKSMRGWVRVSSRGNISVSNPPCETTSESSVSKMSSKTDSEPKVAAKKSPKTDSEPKVAAKKSPKTDSEPKVAAKKSPKTDNEPKVAAKKPSKTDCEPKVAGGLKKDYWGYGKITEYMDTGCKTYEVMGLQNRKPFFKVGNGIYQVFITHLSEDGQTQVDTERKSVSFDKDGGDQT